MLALTKFGPEPQFILYFLGSGTKFKNHWYAFNVEQDFNVTLGRYIYLNIRGMYLKATHIFSPGSLFFFWVEIMVT